MSRATSSDRSSPASSSSRGPRIPDLDPKALAPAEAAELGGRAGFAALLAGMQSAAAGIVEEAARLGCASDW